MTESLVGGTAAAPLSIRATAALASAVVRAARQLLTDLERGRRIDAAVLRGAMEAAFGASDATGAWNWKTAYDACEAATVLFLRRYRLGHARQGGIAGRHAADAGEDREPPSDPHAAIRGKRIAPAVLDTDRHLAWSPASPPRSRRPTSCWSRRLAPAFLPSSPNWLAPHSSSTSSPRAVPAFLIDLFPASPRLG